MPDFKGTRRKPGEYGPDHRKARARAFADLPDWSPCSRCGKPMWKWAKDKQGRSALHYDHTDDRTGYLGFSHGPTCNVRAGATKGARVANNNKVNKNITPIRWRSRNW